MAAAAVSLVDLEKDPRLFLYTSLTAGSSHIITATSRLETILKANKIPFQAIDLATDEKARRLWQRRGGGKKLPGLVKEGFVLGDLAEVEEWNEFGELKENIGPVPANNAAPPGGQTGVNIAPPLLVNPTATQGTTHTTVPPVVSSTSIIGSTEPAPSTGFDKSKGIALPGAAEIAARNKPAPATTETPSSFDALKVETLASSSAEKKESIETAKEVAKNHPSIDHLSAPGSAIHSGTATPQVQAGIPEPAVTDTTITGAAAATATATAGAETAGAGTTDAETTDAETTGAAAADADPAGLSVDTAKDDAVVPTETAPSSEVKDTSVEDIKEIEKKDPPLEKSEPADTRDIEPAATGVESLSLDDAKKESGEAVPTATQEQSAKEGDDAGKSVED